jgi:hypothetical protein
MYWYKSKLPILISGLGVVLLLVITISCKPNVGNSGTAPKYFDIKGYFESEAARLTKLNKPVLKTIVYNKNTETKDMMITDWKRELDFFQSADINKPSWKDSYSVDSTGDIVIYKAKDPSLKMWQMIIKKEGPRIKWILIYNSTKNLLYQTREKLTYFPDSLYMIDKKQSVRVLGTSVYRIKGVFNR